jgi:hypothetical protein
MLTSHIVPILAISGYINYPKQITIDKEHLHTISILHNALLIIFSAWTCISLSKVIYTHGIVFKSNYYFSIPEFDNVLFYFYLSKYYEFIDTFLLYLQGKKPIFLQKYHHIGAAISWHLVYVYKVDAIWLPSLANSFVHTIMYSYYLGCLLKINQVRILKQYITSLQLIQLVGSMSVVVYYYIPPVEPVFNYMIILFVSSYNTFLIGLFCNFYYNNYMTKSIKSV